MVGNQAIERFFAPLGRVQLVATRWVLRLTARERLLVGAMVLVASILAPLKAVDMAQTAEARLVDAQTRLETARQSAGGESIAVNRRIDKELQDVQHWSWSTPSLTVAQVMLEQEMSVMAAQAHMAGVGITSADAVETVGPLHFVRLDVSASFDWLTLTAFLRALSRTHKGFVLSAASVEGDSPSKIRLLLDIPINVIGQQRQ
jgi:hypothetical protein